MTPHALRPSAACGGFDLRWVCRKRAPSEGALGDRGVAGKWGALMFLFEFVGHDGASLEKNPLVGIKPIAALNEYVSAHLMNLPEAQSQDLGGLLRADTG